MSLKKLNHLSTIIVIAVSFSCTNMHLSNNSESNKISINDTLMHVVKLNMKNRGHLFELFQHDYSFKICRFSKDSLNHIEWNIYKKLVNEPRLNKVDIKKNFTKLHRQYIVNQLDGEDYLIVFYVQVLIPGNAFRANSSFWDFPNVGVGNAIRNFSVSYPLFKGKKMALTTVYF